jgi:hypothetical protein
MCNTQKELNIQRLTKLLKPTKNQKAKQNKVTKITTTNPAKNGKINVTRFKNVPALIDAPAYLYIAGIPTECNLWLKAGITFRQIPRIGKKLTQHVIDTQVLHNWQTTLAIAYFAEQKILQVLSNNKIKLPLTANFTEVFDELSNNDNLERTIKAIDQILKNIDKQIDNTKITGSNIEAIYNQLL